MKPICLRPRRSWLRCSLQIPGRSFFKKQQREDFEINWSEIVFDRSERSDDEKQRGLVRESSLIRVFTL